MAESTTEPKRSERRAQARSIATRKKLIEATLDEILAKGYNSATTNDFASRAGVSRGALLHHFPARSDIIVAAMEHLLRDATAEIRDVAAKVARTEVTLGDFVEFLWDMFSGRVFYLSLEFINEARTDGELRAQMMPVVKDFHAALDSIWREFQKQADGGPQATLTALNMTVCLVRGMGVQTVLKDDPAYFRTMLETWKTILPHMLEAAPEARPGKAAE
ncbi:TetR/AcrR family transcriptional regulator [Vannielia litorea]|uniref:TetR/AcrR family transcriptional regulator n=1 Tax=Vannielia litorea TaxID=1217970 RepID=UPI001BCC4AFD|nr:TetR/AcrR family transcriptional regulator [Vannielia litorea]MBS8227952.1 TetR/AcrR family transcriptional regulator [Vannielia litorea]